MSQKLSIKRLSAALLAGLLLTGSAGRLNASLLSGLKTGAQWVYGKLRLNDQTQLDSGWKTVERAEKRLVHIYANAANARANNPNNQLQADTEAHLRDLKTALVQFEAQHKGALQLTIDRWLCPFHLPKCFFYKLWYFWKKDMSVLTPLSITAVPALTYVYYKWISPHIQPESLKWQIAKHIPTVAGIMFSAFWRRPLSPGNQSELTRIENMLKEVNEELILKIQGNYMIPDKLWLDVLPEKTIPELREKIAFYRKALAHNNTRQIQDLAAELTLKRQALKKELQGLKDFRDKKTVIVKERRDGN